ncbi:MAG: APC family permease [Coriobacteriia bacterium]|nr:APC family permease [Coriobacteriia bacterium]
MAGSFKRVLLGKPLHNQEAAHQRLSNPVALATFSSDALSSVAYAPQEILLMLALAGAGALKMALPVVAGVSLLLITVVLSYRQTIKAYPAGGGSYRVAKENLGDVPGVVAGASILVGYILTVAVSVSAAVAAITSAFPQTRPFAILLAITFVSLLAIVNLRGIKEAGALFAGPTFLYVILLGITILIGLSKFVFGSGFSVPVPHDPVEAVQGLGVFLVLRAFASGCTVMTGVEAIADSTQAFREPSSKNASITLTSMAGILLFLFLGVTLLTTLTGLQPSETETIISQLSREIYGTGPFYYLISVSVAVILVLAANTAYADFPQLSSFIAADDYLPHQLGDRGQRLVFSKGIILLTAVAIMLLVVFGGSTTRLIPLYAVGVFTSLTLSQAGMVMHHRRHKEPGWRWSLAINAIGSMTTCVVTIVVGVAKFTGGAWIVVVLIPAIVSLFLWIRRQYVRVGADLAIKPDELTDLNWQSFNRMHNHVIVLVKEIDRRLIRAVQYAKSLEADCLEAVYVDVSGKAPGFKKKWQAADFGVKLTVIDSPYREIVPLVMTHLRSIPRPTYDHVITVILPEYAPESLADEMLHGQQSLFLKQAMVNEPGVIIVAVPYRIIESAPAVGPASAASAAEPATTAGSTPAIRSASATPKASRMTESSSGPSTRNNS